MEEYLAELPDSKSGLGKLGELFRSSPYMPKRVRALQVFAEGAYFQQLLGGESGKTAEQVDREVGELLSVF